MIVKKKAGPGANTPGKNELHMSKNMKIVVFVCSVSATLRSVLPASKGCSPTGRPRSFAKQFLCLNYTSDTAHHCGFADGRAVTPFPPWILNLKTTVKTRITANLADG